MRYRLPSVAFQPFSQLIICLLHAVLGYTNRINGIFLTQSNFSLLESFLNAQFLCCIVARCLYFFMIYLFQSSHVTIVLSQTFISVHAKVLLFELLFHLLLTLDNLLLIGKNLVLIFLFSCKPFLGAFLVKLHHFAKMFQLSQLHGIFVGFGIRQTINITLFQLRELRIIRFIFSFARSRSCVLLLFLHSLLVLRLRLQEVFSRNVRTLHLLFPILHVDLVHACGILLIILLTFCISNAVERFLFRFPIIGRVFAVSLLFLCFRQVRFRFGFLLLGDFLVFENTSIVFLLNLLHALHISFIILFTLYVCFFVERILFFLPILFRLELVRLFILLIIVHYRHTTTSTSVRDDRFFIDFCGSLLAEIVAINIKDSMLLLVLLINFPLNTCLVVFQMCSISSRSRVHGTPFTSPHKI